ncbi:Sigma-54-dependent Fis family transcriptional regulator [Sulfidibacter corallicola]|uniref:Sigma-54-dependent Fis family transcriptional regulator n=1 Tax=Sulfidibacter corallicola TaxID=2818388 RepID=A0A8A4TIR9_SULCO|nr:sigma 54-interacting transcriptional regulator [Sulfidibacter corallicola]QTD49929.1 sigma-54-dependent Fis family transcriptional regulator [Sulfidibacter corallicola]
MTSPFSAHPALQSKLEFAAQMLRDARLLVLTGPSGCGKTYLARQLHESGSRARSPIVFHDAAALSMGLFESQLFGHVKGAFSGATKDFIGLAGVAGDGTLVLEGLEDWSQELQAKLLRFLQMRTYRPVGATFERAFRGVLILTSRLSLNQLHDQGAIREDFFFRLLGAEVPLPDIHGRPEDFETVFTAMKRDLATEVPHPARDLDDHDLQAARELTLEGNYHGLRNVMMRAMITGLPIAELPSLEAAPHEDVGDLPNTGSLKEDLHVLEGRLLRRGLEVYPHNRKELAAHLGISLRSLMYKLKEHGLN